MLEGAKEGFLVGSAVGLNVGSLGGSSVGIYDGTMVGLVVGLYETVGRLVGFTVGRKDGR